MLTIRPRACFPTTGQAENKGMIVTGAIDAGFLRREDRKAAALKAAYTR